MQPLPAAPFAFQARVMDALLDDIRDTRSPTFARLDAIREVSKQQRDGGTPNKLPPRNS